MGDIMTKEQAINYVERNQHLRDHELMENLRDAGADYEIAFDAVNEGRGFIGW